MEQTSPITIHKRKLSRLVRDASASAEAINLIYVTDSAEGIRRERSGEGFIYLQGKKRLTDAPTLARIKSLVLPPAWEQVWICSLENGHLQATGIDARGRKQYKYHPLWHNLRNHTKFYHLLEFGKALPLMRSRIDQDLSRSGLPLEKVLAAAVALMQQTSIRVGSSAYEKLYGSFGLTTLKDQHVTIKGHKLHFSFKGKKGIYHNISLCSRKLARIVGQCRDIPGKELFQYYDEKGQRHSIDSGQVNQYIKEISGGDFTAKDFRTWMGSLQALQAFRELGDCESDAEIKKRIVEALDRVAAHLGNTRAVCKKYYVHPALIDMYANRSLQKFLEVRQPSPCPGLPSDLTPEEELLMEILQKAGPVKVG